MQHDYMEELHERKTGGLLPSEPIVIMRVEFNHLVAAARTLPEIVYYMYDLNAAKSVSIETKVAELRTLLQRLAELDAEIATLGMLWLICPAALKGITLR